MTHSPQDDAPVQLPRSIRLLQWLVIGLTASLILGVLTMVVVIVIRFAGPPASPPPINAENLELPAGMAPLSVTLGSDWLGVVTTDDHILIYDRQSGKLRQTLTVTRP